MEVAILGPAVTLAVFLVGAYIGRARVRVSITPTAVALPSVSRATGRIGGPVRMVTTGGGYAPGRRVEVTTGRSPVTITRWGVLLGTEDIEGSSLGGPSLPLRIEGMGAEVWTFVEPTTRQRGAFKERVYVTYGSRGRRVKSRPIYINDTRA